MTRTVMGVPRFRTFLFEERTSGMYGSFSLRDAPEEMRAFARVLLYSTDRDALYDAAELAVKLYPRSRSLIERVLFGPDRMARAQAHSLVFFHFGASSPAEGMRRSIRKYAIKLAERYLVTLKVDRCSAAYMAADFLGEHCPLYVGRTALMAIVRKGRYSEGRSASVMRLRDVCERLMKKRSKRAKVELRRIRALLEDLALHDRDVNVQSAARVVLRMVWP